MKNNNESSGEDREFLYSYNPFKPSSVFLTDLSETDITDCYPEKTGNLYGTPLRVSLFNFVPNAINKTLPFSSTQRWGGIEGGAMQPLAQYLNTTYKIVGPNDGKLFGFEKIVNETFASLTGGATEDLAMKRADVAINSRSLMPAQYSEAIYPFYKENVVVVVPKAHPIPQYLSFLRAFDIKMRILIIISIFIACIINKLFKHFYNERDKTFFKAFLQTLVSFLGGSVFNLPTNQASRLYYISWTIYCFFIINAFTSTIISIFVVPMYGKDIDTLADVLNSPYYIHVIEERINISKMYGHNKSNVICCADEFSKLTRKFIGIKVNQFYAELENNNLNFAYIFVQSKAKHIVNLKRFSNAGRPIYHIIKETAIPGFATITIQRGSPFQNTFNKFFRLSIEAGLLKHWETIGGYFHPELPETQEHYHSLNIDKFEAAFIIYIIGVIVSLCCFFGEFIVIIWKQYQRKLQLLRSNDASHM